MSEPSVKGTIFGAVAEEIQALRESGRISEDQLAAALESQDIAILETKTLPASWYPMATYARYLDLLCRVEGRGAPAYYEKRGHMSARRLMDAGMYAQLALLDSIATDNAAEDAAAEQAALRTYRKQLTVVISLAGSIYNVGQWKVVDDPEHPGRVSIEIRDAGAYSDGMVRAIVGFLDECAHSVIDKIDKLYDFDRPERDRVVIRMLRDLAVVRRDRNR